jgi:hypothetical protein
MYRTEADCQETELANRHSEADIPKKESRRAVWQARSRAWQARNGAWQARKFKKDLFNDDAQAEKLDRRILYEPGVAADDEEL